MNYLNLLIPTMTISIRLIALRRGMKYTQQEMADKVGLHVNQIRRYESGSAQPSLEALKKMAKTLNVSIDSIVFDQNERGPDDELRLQFEAVSKFTKKEKEVTKTVLESLILRHDSNRFSQQARG